MTVEVWKDIPSHRGYQVSSEGRVRSLDREVLCRNGRTKKLKGKLLKPSADPFGYMFVQLGRGCVRRVHSLVALTFIGPRPEGLYACHEDGVCTNNIKTNIYYGTPKQNQHDRRKHGTALVGEKHPMSRLTERQVGLIRSRYRAGERQKTLGEEYGVTQSQISNIVNGKAW